MPEVTVSVCKELKSTGLKPMLAEMKELLDSISHLDFRVSETSLTMGKPPVMIIISDANNVTPNTVEVMMVLTREVAMKHLGLATKDIDVTFNGTIRLCRVI